jgi:hypothetical protein
VLLLLLLLVVLVVVLLSLLLLLRLFSELALSPGAGNFFAAGAAKSLEARLLRSGTA